MSHILGHIFIFEQEQYNVSLKYVYHSPTHCCSCCSSCYHDDDDDDDDDDIDDDDQMDWHKRYALDSYLGGAQFG
jgi:hypothetical protein